MSSLFSRLQGYLKISQDLQLTIWDPDNESAEYRFRATIAEKQDGRIRVVPEKQLLSSEVQNCLMQGLVIGAALEVHPSPFIFYPRVESALQPLSKGLWLRLSEEMDIEVLERRRHVRIPMSLPLKVNIPGNQTLQSLKTLDVSGGGLRFASTMEFSLEQILSLSLQLKPDVELSLKAHVVLSMKNQVISERIGVPSYVTACQFVDLEPAHEALIMKECFRRELMLKNL